MTQVGNDVQVAFNPHDMVTIKNAHVADVSHDLLFV